MVDEPAGAGVCPAKRLNGLAVFEEMKLLSAKAPWQEQPQHVLAHEGIHHLGRELAAAIHLGAMLVQQRLQGASPLRWALGDRRLNAGIHVSSIT